VHILFLSHASSRRFIRWREQAVKARGFLQKLQHQKQEQEKDGEQQTTTVTTSNVSKYYVGQQVSNLGPRKATGLIMNITPDDPSTVDAAGPGILEIRGTASTGAAHSTEATDTTAAAAAPAAAPPAAAPPPANVAATAVLTSKAVQPETPATEVQRATTTLALMRPSQGTTVLTSSGQQVCPVVRIGVDSREVDGAYRTTRLWLVRVHRLRIEAQPEFNMVTEGGGGAAAAASPRKESSKKKLLWDLWALCSDEEAGGDEGGDEGGDGGAEGAFPEEDESGHWKPLPLPKQPGAKLLVGRGDFTGIRASNISRGQAELVLGPAADRDSADGKDMMAIPQVQVVGGGSNAVFIVHPSVHAAADGSMAQVKMALVAKGEERCMVVGDVIEIDGFKRRNPKKFPEGPQIAYQLVALPVGREGEQEEEEPDTGDI
jgi:hypothetical protein